VKPVVHLPRDDAVHEKTMMSITGVKQLFSKHGGAPTIEPPSQRSAASCQLSFFSGFWPPLWWPLPLADNKNADLVVCGLWFFHCTYKNKKKQYYTMSNSSTL